MNTSRRRVLYHYTNEVAYKKILTEKKLLPSLQKNNPRDVRYGNGQYLSDIPPGTRRVGQLSYRFLRIPYLGRRFTHWIAIDVSGLHVVEGREGVFVIPGDRPLDIEKILVSHGKN